MRHVHLSAHIPATTPQDVFDGVVRFDRYPDLAPHVQSTVVHQSVPHPTGQSSWELHFRSGLLRWTEQERFLRDELRIEFTQTDGDFDSFTGAWQLTGGPDGTDLGFDADFDFGIPSLEGILDPIAERVIRETVAWVVIKMFEGARLADDVIPATARPAPVVPGTPS
ncbi:type II toxin-antitoxin system RatA family toxin [Salinispora mooreana]|uniref:type II toxin-antitoxin system RatA family toxin n=1 Tax=Salinispora mooreana TaxID=999545 RepID=UPI00036FB3BC|nr:SRPBCC family protein [Salinispora mooreana]